MKNKKISQKEMLHNYNVMRENYLTDIDMSGSLYIEYQEVTNDKD